MEERAVFFGAVLASLAVFLAASMALRRSSTSGSFSRRSSLHLVLTARCE